MADVTRTELGVLEVLWDQAPRTIREITEQLYPDGGPSEYGTVQKLLDRLAAKGCVQRTRAGRAHQFTPTVAREDLIRHRLRSVADQLCGGAIAPLMTQLVNTEGMSPGELDELRRLLQDAEERQREDPS